MIRRFQNTRCVRRSAGTSPVVTVLLAGILLALAILIALLVTQRGGQSTGSASRDDPPATVTVADGQKVQRPDLPSLPKSPQPIGDPGRIKEVLQEGKTYQVVLKIGLDARVEDKAWGVKQVVSMAYAAEMAIDRSIERNDGKRIVEVRYFATSRNVKLLCSVESVTISLGTPGTLILGALEYVYPGTIQTLATVRPVAEAILSYGAEDAARSEATRAVAHVNSLSGKKVRITYVNGIGVDSIEPIGCTLTAAERDFVFNTAVLSDYYILPDVKLKPVLPGLSTVPS